MKNYKVLSKISETSEAYRGKVMIVSDFMERVVRNVTVLEMKKSGVH